MATKPDRDPLLSNLVTTHRSLVEVNGNSVNVLQISLFFGALW